VIYIHFAPQPRDPGIAAHLMLGSATLTLAADLYGTLTGFR